MASVTLRNTHKENKREKSECSLLIYSFLFFKLSLGLGLDFGHRVRGARRNFFRRGKRRSHYLLDKIKPYNCNQDFAKGFEPKVNNPVKKILKFGRHVEQSDAIQVHYERRFGKPPVAGQFSQFLEKNTTLTSFESHFECF